MTGWLEQLDEDERTALKRAKHPDLQTPMLATLTERRFSDPAWLFERKLDGERALAFRDGRKIRLMSRNRKSLNDSYPELAQALRAQPCRDFVADGEVVAFDGRRTSFARLQQRMQLKNLVPCQACPQFIS
jgi:bifunctional non-homologous end joining protein LigD